MIRDNAHAAQLQEDYDLNRFGGETEATLAASAEKEEMFICERGISLDDITEERCAYEDRDDTEEPIFQSIKLTEKRLIVFTRNAEMGAPFASAGVLAMARYGAIQNRKMVA